MRVPISLPQDGAQQADLRGTGSGPTLSHLLLQVGLLLLHQLAHPLGLHCLFEELFPRQDPRSCQKPLRGCLAFFNRMPQDPLKCPAL